MLYSFIKKILKIVYFAMFRVEVAGLENIPLSGGAVICPNHISNHDAILVALLIKRKLAFLAKEELFAFKPFGYIIEKLGAIAIKRGSGDIGAVKKAVEVLKSGKMIIIFPEGTRNKTKETLIEFKSGASLIAYKSQCPIIPCAISGRYKLFSKLKVTFAPPINTVFESKPDLHILTEDIKSSVKNILEENR